MSQDDDGASTGGAVHKAGLFDIRNIIGGLLAVYGVILLATAAFGTTDAELHRADGVHANLWSGIVLLIVGVLFVVWARLRPVVVDEADLERDDGADDGPGGA